MNILKHIISYNQLPPHNIFFPYYPQTVIIKFHSSPQNENLNLLVGSKLLNVFLYSSK